MAAALDNRRNELLELRPVDAHREVLGAARIGRDEREVDVGGQGAGQLHLGLLGRLAHTLRRHRVLLEVDAGLAHELPLDVVDEHVVHVRSAQLRVAAGGDDLEPALLPHLHDRHVERSAAEIENEYF